MGVRAPAENSPYVTLLRANIRPALSAYLGLTRANLATMQGELGPALDDIAKARLVADQVGDPVSGSAARLFAAEALGQTGSLDLGEAAFQELASFCERYRLGFTATWGVLHHAHLHLITSSVERAIEMASTLLDGANRFAATTARAMLAHAHLRKGDTAGAQREAQRAMQEADALALPSVMGIALGALALLECKNGHPREALALLERGLEADAQTPWPWTGSMLRLARVETFHALGDIEDAQRALRDARERTVRTANTLNVYPALRRAFLNNVTVNSRIMDLARDWLGETEVSS